MQVYAGSFYLDTKRNEARAEHNEIITQALADTFKCYDHLSISFEGKVYQFTGVKYRSSGVTMIGFTYETVTVIVVE